MNAIVSHCTINSLQQAAANLLNGGLVAFPTETVYGLGADAMNANAVDRMYQVKGRPTDHPVIVHLASMDDVTFWAAEIPDYAINLMRDFWPGPMTLILPRSENAADFITGGQTAVGLRVPAQTIAETLLTEFRKQGGKGIAAPSANRYGSLSPTDAAAVTASIGDFLAPTDQIIDGGPCVIGVESTIIDCTTANPKILRPGAITAEMIEASTGIVLAEANQRPIRVSGSHEKHYSPIAQLSISDSAEPGDGFIALAEVTTPAGAIRLAQPTSIEEYARELYSALRSADTQGISRVSIVPPSGDGLAIAIRDRITRASH